MTHQALDLFSGTGSATKYFRKSDDWQVHGVDINPDREGDMEMDILELEAEMIESDIDFIWASPPCKSFSLGSDNSWFKNNERLRMPENEKAENGIRMVYRSLRLIRELNPEYWFLENPRGGLRAIIGEPQHDKRRQLDKELSTREQKDANYPGTVTYCQFGDNRMKPTDLWGEHPDSITYPFCGNGEPCHTSAPRGSDTGTQGRSNKSDRWRIPDELAKTVFEAVHEEIVEKGN